MIFFVFLIKKKNLTKRDVVHITVTQGQQSLAAFTHIRKGGFLCRVTDPLHSDLNLVPIKILPRSPRVSKKLHYLQHCCFFLSLWRWHL